MNFLTWLTTKRKTLTSMTAADLRAEEMLLDNECARMQAKIGKLAADKQKVIEQGAAEKTPELRRTFAQQFDLFHTEQMMLARHLNIRSKERLTVSRLRMLRENTMTSRVGDFGRVNIREADLAKIEQLIETDSVSTEVYQEKLDAILKLGHEADASGASISPAAAELLRIWNDMDSGLIKNSKEAFDEAERRVRERAAEQ